MAAFVTDSFTDTTGTNITSHTGETGATWTKHATANNTNHPQVSSNALITTEASKNENYYASGSPAAADYTVSLRYTYNGTSGNEIAGPAARMDTAASTGYFAIYYKTQGQIRLYKYVTGTLTQLGSGVSFTPTSGASYDITIDVAGTTIAARMQRVSDSQWYSSGAAWGASQVNFASATDSSISSAGKAGFWFSNGAGDSRGTIDAFSADEAGGSDTALTVDESSHSHTADNLTLSTDSAANLSIADSTHSHAADSLTLTTSIPYDIVDTTDTLTGQQIRILVPNASSAVPYSAGTPTPVILYVHGSGETYTALTSDALKAGCVNALINAGYILAGSTAHSNNWGNEASVNDYTALDQYVRAHYNVKGVALWSQSMGGLDGLSIVAQGQFKVLGWLGTYPACSLSNIYGIGTYTSAINTAYGITGSGIYTYANQTNGYDPVTKGAWAFRDTPMRFYASSGDTVVPKANNTDVMAAIVAGTRSEAAVVACTGNHGDTSHFVPSEYVDFFDRCFAATARTVSVALTSDGTTPVASATGLKWAFWENTTPGSLLAPVAQGTTETTDGSGVLSIPVTTRLGIGDVGWLVVSDSDGTTTQSPAHKAFAGPVTVS